MIKRLLRDALNKVVDRNSFNETHYLYKTYMRIFLPSVHSMRDAERHFYRSAIGPHDDGTIFDIGANEGSKAIIFLSIASNVVCVEANPETAEKLVRRFRKNARVKIVPTACGAKIGTARLNVYEQESAYNTLSDKWVIALAQNVNIDRHLVANRVVDVPVTTLDSLIEIYGLPHYIKIDVEGFELEVIKGLSRSVPFISVECNLPTFKRETLEIIDIVESLNEAAVFNYVISEPPVRFCEDRWLSAAGIRRVLEDDRFEFMEIFCRSKPES